VNPSITTDSTGAFSFKDLEPGSYRVTFETNGLVRQEYGQRTFPGQGTPITLTAGQVRDDLAISMLPTGSVRGRIRNEDKEPAPVIPIRLFRTAYNANGQRNLQYIAATQTDDRGEYRMYHVTPGSYYMAVGTPPGAESSAAASGALESYPVSYYPGVVDLSQAKAVDIAPGAEIALDLTLARQPRYHIRGKIVDSRTGTPPSSVRIALTPRSQNARSYEIGSQTMSYNVFTGAYDLPGILPGSYLLSVTWGDQISIPASFIPRPGPVDNNDPAARAAQRSQTTAAMATIDEGVAYAAVNVASSDIENLTLTIVGGGSIAGRIRLEGAAINGQGGLTSMKVQLKVALDGAPASIPNIYGGRPANVDAAGSFRLDNVKQAEYRVAVDGLSPGLYVKEARYGANDALNRSFQFTSTESIVLDIVIAAGAAEIAGAITTERLEAAPGAQVVLIPERFRDRVELFRSTVSDANGRFTIPNVVPGDYKLYAWEVLEPFAYFDPDVLQRDQPKAKNIHVAEFGNQTADIRVIPAKQETN
jgi:hypothetical protein